MRVLLVEDDQELNATIAKYLRKEGFEVASCFETSCALEKIEQENFDLLLLDVKVPGENGFEFLERHSITIPTIYITSLNSVEDIARGFHAGAIEYIKKPFALKELKIRIDALFKREEHLIKITQDLAFDPQKGALIINRHHHFLPPKEAQILQLLLERKNSIVSTEELLEISSTKDALRTYIKNLRKVLPHGSIETIKEVGYRFVSGN